MHDCPHPPIQTSELLDGLLEPLAEDRLTAQEAIDIATGKAAKRRRQASAASSKAVPAAGGERTMTMPDGSIVRIMGPGAVARPLLRDVRKPAGTRVQLEKSANRLDIEIPPEGLSSGSVGTGLFAVAWNAFVAVRAGSIAAHLHAWVGPSSSMCSKIAGLHQNTLTVLKGTYKGCHDCTSMIANSDRCTTHAVFLHPRHIAVLDLLSFG